MEEANFLTRFGSEISLVHRRDAFRASKIMAGPRSTNPKIKFLTNTAVEDVYDISQNLVTGVRLKNLLDGREWTGSRRILPRDRPYPEHEAFQRPDRSRSEGLHRQPHGARTNITGVFHAGDVQRPHYASHYSVGAGCMAAMEAESF